MIGGAAASGTASLAQARAQAPCRRPALRWQCPDTAAMDTSRPAIYRSTKAEGAFSLIELIGVLTVIAILVAVMVPTLIRQMDRIAGEQETVALQSLSDALQQSILRKRYIPGASDWATNLAAELGVDVGNINLNARRQPRFFLIDPNLRIGNNSSGLPYTQTNLVFGSVTTNNTGLVIPPLSPRVIILSSIGRALPTDIVSGIVSNNNFSAIWDRNDTASALPATSFAWAGWPNGDDLKVQRVHLSPLFMHLVLTANNSSTNSAEMGYYSIDTTSTNYNVPSIGPGRDGYFIKNSSLYLYMGRTNMDSQQILDRDTSFVYEQNVWRSSLTGGSFLAGSLDLGSIVDKYLDAPENMRAMYTLTNNIQGNTNVSLTQQSFVVSNMIAYMKAYTNWAAAGFPNNGLKSAAAGVRQAMIDGVHGQYDAAYNGKDYRPFPQACPP